MQGQARGEEGNEASARCAGNCRRYAWAKGGRSCQEVPNACQASGASAFSDQSKKRPPMSDTENPEKRGAPSQGVSSTLHGPPLTPGPSIHNMSEDFQ